MLHGLRITGRVAVGSPVGLAVLAFDRVRGTLRLSIVTVSKPGEAVVEHTKMRATERSERDFHCSGRRTDWWDWAVNAGKSRQ